MEARFIKVMVILIAISDKTSHTKRVQFILGPKDLVNFKSLHRG